MFRKKGNNVQYSVLRELVKLLSRHWHSNSNILSQFALAASQAIHVTPIVYSRWIFDRVAMVVWSRFGWKWLLPLWLRFHSFPLPSLGVLCGFCSGAGPSDIYAGFRFCLPDPSTAPSRVRIRIHASSLSVISHGGG